MTGKDIYALSIEGFCGRAPSFVADILWEHLVLLQKDVDAAALKNVLSNLSETLTEPGAGSPPYRVQRLDLTR